MPDLIEDIQILMSASVVNLLHYKHHIRSGKLHYTFVREEAWIRPNNILVLLQK